MAFIFKFWVFWLLPPCFYGGGGGGSSTVTTPQTNPEEQALAQISDEKWAEYKARYVPLENQWIEQVKGLNDPVQHNKAATLASNEVKTQYSPQTQVMQQSMQEGRMPAGQYLDQARDIGQARTVATLGVTDRYLKGLEGVIAMGQGQSAQAIQGLSDVADTSVRGQIDKNNNTFSRKQSNDAMYGTVAGGVMAAGANANTIKKMAQ